MKDILNYLDGHKTVITSILLMIVQSDLMEKLINNPDLYSLMQGIFGLLFAGSLGHHVKKAVKK